MPASNLRPSVLCFSGLDPSGGAGLQADIESIAYCGGHALPIASCLTAQNSSRAFSVHPIEPHLLQQQAEILLQDMRVASCKIGVIPDEMTASTIAGIISQIPDIPIVFDPVINASNGISFTSANTIKAIKDQLLPLVSVITPNHSELHHLISAGECNTSKAQSLCQLGPQYVLLTGADQQGNTVSNTLYSKDGIEHDYQWPRLPRTYHGSGCTLSSALACFLAIHPDVHLAADKAQAFTWKALEHAEPLGAGQWIPKRYYTDTG